MERQQFASQMQQEMIGEIEARRPTYLAAIWASLSWLPQPGSDNRILLWLVRYLDRCYEPAARISNFVTVFARTSASPCGVGFDSAPLSERPSTPEHLEMYKRVLQIQPDLVGDVAEKGRQLAEHGNVKEGIAYFAEVLKFDPESAGGHYNLAIALASSGQVDGAIAHLREAVRVDQGFADAHNNLATLLMEQGNLNEALVELEKAIRLLPNRPDFHFNEAVVFYRRHDLPRALQSLRAAVAIDPAYAPARQMLEELTKRRP
jgi:tetratricopeptide (TPR) repeat protein